MKCPERYRVIQQNIRQPILDDDRIVKGEYQVLIEIQQFSECYKEQCAAWDSEKKMCRKVGGE